MRGRFITFEGIDGAGKSSHIGWYVEQLRERGIDVAQTREPGGTSLAEDLRDLLLSDSMPMQAELMLVFAARVDHLEKLIRPALSEGRWVVCDRFTDSTWAYQGSGRGADPHRIAWLEQWVHGDLQPDRTYLFDLPAELAAERRVAARIADRFEREGLEFFERVRSGYLHRLATDPQRFLEIDSRQSIDDIRKVLSKDIVSI
jgi:dTMP kinase